MATQIDGGGTTDKLSWDCHLPPVNKGMRRTMRERVERLSLRSESGADMKCATA